MSTNIPYIKSSAPYKSIGRKLLLNDQLVGKELPAYWRDIGTKAYLIPKRGVIPTSIVEPESFLVPTIELGISPKIKKNILNSTPFDLQARANERAEESIERLEDVEVFKAINVICPVDHSINVTGSLQPENLLLAMRLITEHHLPVGYITMHPTHIQMMRLWEIKSKNFDFKINKDKKILQTGIGGSFNNVKILVSNMCPKNAVYVTAEPEYLGVIAIRHEDEVYDKDDTLFVMKDRVRELGVCVINDYGVTRIVINTPGTMPVQEKPKEEPSKPETISEKEEVSKR